MNPVYVNAYFHFSSTPSCLCLVNCEDGVTDLLSLLDVAIPVLIDNHHLCIARESKSGWGQGDIFTGAYVSSLLLGLLLSTAAEFEVGGEDDDHHS